MRSGDEVSPTILAGEGQPAGFVVLITGLSAAGKSTLARGLESRIGARAVVLDGDEMRSRLGPELGFDDEGRRVNVERTAWVAAQIARQGGNVLCALMAPFGDSREKARSYAEAAGVTFLHVHVDAQLDLCISRDPKGLYLRAMRGETKHVSGFDAPYEVPEHPDVRVLGDLSSEAGVQVVLEELQRRGLL